MGFNEINTCYGKSTLDMWVDFTYHENTGGLQEVFNYDAVKDYINDLNDRD